MMIDNYGYAADKGRAYPNSRGMFRHSNGIIKEGWGSYGSALYCPKCTRTWEERNGTNRPMPGKYNTLRIIDGLYIESAPKTVTEYCSECETENTMVWDVKTEGYKAYCPHCGKVMMLCDACTHSDDEPIRCYDEHTPMDECMRTWKGNSDKG